MNYRYFVIFMSVLLFSCEKRKFEKLEFSYNDIETNFSMKFNRSDTVYIDETSTMGTPKKYYAIFNKAERKTLDSFANMLISKNFDSIYDKNKEEQSNIKYKFRIRNQKDIKTISVYEKWANLNLIDANYYAPKDLHNFSLWLYYRKQKLEKNYIE
jgi:hypothetical protein